MRSRTEGVPISSSGGEHDRHRQLRLDTGAGELADGFEGEIVPALHVADAGPVADIPVAPEGQFLQRADGMHRVEMAEDQDTGLAGIGMRKARTNAVAEPPSGPESARWWRPCRRVRRKRDPSCGLTAAASQVGLSHSIHGRSPSSIASASKGSALISMISLPGIRYVCFCLSAASVSETGRKLPKSQSRPGAASISARV